MLRRWYFTVFSVIPSSAAISLLRRPAVTSRRTSSSRAVSRSAPARRPAASQAREMADDPGGGGRGDRRLAPGDRLDHGPQLGGLEILEEVAAGSGPDGGEEVLLVLAHGEHHDRRLGPGRGDRAGRLDAGHPGHPDVHEHQVGLEPEDQRDRLARRPTRGRRPRVPRPAAATTRRRGTGRDRRRARSASAGSRSGSGRPTRRRGRETDAAAALRRARPVDRRADAGRPLAHRLQAVVRSVGGAGAGPDPAPVVGDDDLEPTVADREGDLGARGARSACGRWSAPPGRSGRPGPRRPARGRADGRRRASTRTAIFDASAKRAA